MIVVGTAAAEVVKQIEGQLAVVLWVLDGLNGTLPTLY
jgi:hypothetical protein